MPTSVKIQGIQMKINGFNKKKIITDTVLEIESL